MVYSKKKKKELSKIKKNSKIVQNIKVKKWENVDFLGKNNVDWLLCIEIDVIIEFADWGYFCSANFSNVRNACKQLFLKRLLEEEPVLILLYSEPSYDKWILNHHTLSLINNSFKIFLYL